MSRQRRLGFSYFLAPIILILFLALILLLQGPQNLPYKEAVVTFSPDSSPEEIANILFEKGLIWNRLHFTQEARVQHLQVFFKGGEYLLRSDMGIPEIVRRLKEHEVLQYKFVIPEGATIEEIADIFSQTPLRSVENTVSPTPFINKNKFLKLAQEGKDNFNFPFKNQDPLPSLEGYLFPDTYILPRMSEEELISTMLENFSSKIDVELLDRARKMGWSFHEVLTLASIIEKEAGVEEEKPVISSVFYNRLAIGMKLESDPTVAYALGNPKRPLTYEDLGVDSPYNTYLYPGLPPGPICNPGLSSIKAALYPASTNYYYFVATGDGRHLFAETYQEHLNNIAKLNGE
jgi:UPF0755 protein